MNNYIKQKKQELYNKIQTCNYNDNGNLIDIISDMFYLLDYALNELED